MGDDVLVADREIDVMVVLWGRGSGTVAEVLDALPDALAYTTVLTVLRTLEQKGIVAHVVTGQAHRYVPLVPQKTVRRSAIDRLLGQLFAGAPEQLLAHLVEDHAFTARDIERLRAQIDAIDPPVKKKPARTKRK